MRSTIYRSRRRKIEEFADTLHIKRQTRGRTMNKVKTRSTEVSSTPVVVPAPIKLLPCPFCGGEADVDLYREEVFSAQCCDCGGEGPCAETKKEAAALWNQRISN